MTLDEAIEVLERDITHEPAYGNPIIIEATKLGIEAMKDLRLLRLGMDYELLPGEERRSDEN